MALSARSTTPKSSTGPKEQPKKGSKLMRLVGLVDLGHQPGFMYQGEMMPSAEKVEFIWELVTEKMTDGRNFWVSEEVKVSDYEPKEPGGITSGMMKRVRCLEAAGKDSDNGNNLSYLIGEPAMGVIDHNAKGYAKITNITPAPDGFPVPELMNDPIIFDFTDPDRAVWERLTDFTKSKIKKAHNYGDDLKPKLQALGIQDV